MGKYFGTDGIRGIVGKDLTEEFVEHLGLAAGSILPSRSSGRPTVVVGRDTRASGAALENAIARGFCRAGVDVVCVDVLPTAAIALLTATHSFDAGVVISASHNPREWNGIKFFNSAGYKLSEDFELSIENAIDSLPGDRLVPGKTRNDPVLANAYLHHLLNAGANHLDSYSLIIDCAHGAASTIAPSLFEIMGASVVLLNAEPNGANINENCGALHPDEMACTVVNNGAALGIAFDGDADRCIFSDENGQILDGDHVLAMCAADRVTRDLLPGHVVVGTDASSMSLEIALKSINCSLVRAQVGDRYVLEEMQRSGALLGGEPSGHTIFLDRTTTGDGLLTAVMVTNLVAQSGKRLSELADILQSLPQAALSVPVIPQKKTLKNAANRSVNMFIASAIQTAKERLGDTGRIVVRPSGTEPVVRVLVEGADATMVQQLAQEVADTIQTHWTW